MSRPKKLGAFALGGLLLFAGGYGVGTRRHAAVEITRTKTEDASTQATAKVVTDVTQTTNVSGHGEGHKTVTIKTLTTKKPDGTVVTDRTEMRDETAKSDTTAKVDLNVKQTTDTTTTETKHVQEQEKTLVFGSKTSTAVGIRIGSTIDRRTNLGAHLDRRLFGTNMWGTVWADVAGGRPQDKHPEVRAGVGLRYEF